jgi:hypothetical protein
MTDEHEPARPRLLAVMPSGDAFRADEVVAVKIVEDEALLGAERPRFAVTIRLRDGSVHGIAYDLAHREAIRIANEAAREVNGRLLASHQVSVA